MFPAVRYHCAVVQDVLADDHIKLDENFKNSFIGEIIKVCNRKKRSILLVTEFLIAFFGPMQSSSF